MKMNKSRRMSRRLDTDPVLPSSFNRRRWKKENNPSLILYQPMLHNRVHTMYIDKKITKKYYKQLCLFVQDVIRA